MNASMRINRRVINNLKKEKEKTLEEYEMQRQLAYAAEIKYIKIGNFRMANFARAKQSCLDTHISWHEGIIAGYKISLSLMKQKRGRKPSFFQE